MSRELFEDDLEFFPWEDYLHKPFGAKDIFDYSLEVARKALGRFEENERIRPFGSPKRDRVEREVGFADNRPNAIVLPHPDSEKADAFDSTKTVGVVGPIHYPIRLLK